ncbi:hydantoinase/oxoprolinase family protein [Peribacillus cavernae]|uniref:Hydantoinase/oxoprolinase family protein n=1 Tax=Peribacillus cavernae TaxID=1674310 RepID=A0A433HFI0_9BACI|nr:hydantoinase/oxoprolinase family protein [Peribacillus cavernae]MDQ0219485.1 N-methylhydantoinase A [Peribacillus cavernae]RUQ27096.1 hydantoinase/oxoprolinase family protein [Peribacillus cavernae]
MSWRIGIDIGGTFTDVVAFNEEIGSRKALKVRSTPKNPSESFLNGIRSLKDMGIESSDISMVMHGTTVATNAILESKYSEMGLIVTGGYREMLECARQTVPGDFGDIVTWIKPPRVVPLELVREIPGRLDYKGDELRPLDEEAVRKVAREFKEIGVPAIAVSLINSYRNPIHEEKVREIIKDEYPSCYVSISTDVIREYREYERTVSTCLNTGLMPSLSSYVEKLTEQLENTQNQTRFYIMQSSGGLTDSETIKKQPISAVLSGPAAGVVSAAALAKTSDFHNLITLDMGGTSTDICLIENGEPKMLTEGQIDVYNIKTPMVDMTTVGAGGGSIAWLTAGNSLKVGPESAGSDPGPACYGYGGEHPTITDAHLILGRIPTSLADGNVVLKAEASRKVIEEKIASPLNLTVEEAADGIIQIGTENIARGINLVSISRGQDPRMYALYPFGGAGGLHACRSADILKIKRVIVPLLPGLTSAEGLLLTDIRADEVITDVQREDELDITKLQSEFKIVREKSINYLKNEGFNEKNLKILCFMDFRYWGQAFEIRVPVDLPAGGQVSEKIIRDTINKFHHFHLDRYGYSYETKELVEIVNIGATGVGLLNPLQQTEYDSNSRDLNDALVSENKMYVTKNGKSGYYSVPVYDRYKIPVNKPFEGPAIIKQFDSTFVMEPEWTAQVDHLGYIICEKKGGI